MFRGVFQTHVTCGPSAYTSGRFTRWAKPSESFATLAHKELTRKSSLRSMSTVLAPVGFCRLIISAAQIVFLNQFNAACFAEGLLTPRLNGASFAERLLTPQLEGASFAEAFLHPTLIRACLQAIVFSVSGVLKPFSGCVWAARPGCFCSYSIYREGGIFNEGDDNVCLLFASSLRIHPSKRKKFCRMPP